MEESDFEGTLVLEKLATKGFVEGFFEAIDADDFEKAASLIKKPKLTARQFELC